MRKKVILITFFIFFHFISFSQIKFTNPGFEDKSHSNTPPIGWDICAGTPDCNGYDPQTPWYIAPYQGGTYLGIQCDLSAPPPNYESAGQFINCHLIAKKKHSFTLYAYEVSYVRVGFFNPGARVQFWGGSGKCDLDTLLWQSPVLDTMWQQYTAEFVPNKPYTYITFLANNINNKASYLGIDDLSDITVDSGRYNLLSTSIIDTTIKKYGCVTINASSDDTTATFKWSSVPSGFTDSGKSVMDCPTVNTQYICTATYGCGYQRSDTVNVEVTPSGVKNIEAEDALSIYPNPVQNHLQLSNLPKQSATLPKQSATLQYTIINTLGQIKQSNTLPPNNTLANINVAALPAGIYFIRLTDNKGFVYSTKFVKE